MPPHAKTVTKPPCKKPRRDGVWRGYVTSLGRQTNSKEPWMAIEFFASRVFPWMGKLGRPRRGNVPPPRSITPRYRAKRRSEPPHPEHRVDGTGPTSFAYVYVARPDGCRGRRSFDERTRIS